VDCADNPCDDLRLDIADIRTEFHPARDDVDCPGVDGARLTVKTDEKNEIETFELLIVRDGRETDIATLSEGGQDPVEIIVALAGHRTFDVSDRVPVVLLDGTSQLSAENLRLLTDYLADTSDILFTTASPKRASSAATVFFRRIGRQSPTGSYRRLE